MYRGGDFCVSESSETMYCSDHGVKLDSTYTYLIFIAWPKNGLNRPRETRTGRLDCNGGCVRRQRAAMCGEGKRGKEAKTGGMVGRRGERD